MPLAIKVLTLFPDMVRTVLETSIPGRAAAAVPARRGERPPAATEPTDEPIPGDTDPLPAGWRLALVAAGVAVVGVVVLAIVRVAVEVLEIVLDLV